MRNYGWIGFFLLAFTPGACAQLRAVPPDQPLDFDRVVLRSLPLPLADLDVAAAQTPPPLRTMTRRVPQAYRYEDLALFCRIEVQLERATKIPVRFRLGSVDYVDYLEGKRDFMLHSQR